MMYIRTATGECKHGKAQDFANAWKDYVLPTLERMPGFRGAYITCDHGTNKSLGLSFWDSPPDEHEINNLTESGRDKLGQYVEGPPTFETYEVLAHSKTPIHA